MHFFFVVQQILEEHQHQEGSSESADADVCLLEISTVLFPVVEGQIDHRAKPQIGHNRHNDDGKQKAHPEDCNENTPGQEALLP